MPLVTTAALVGHARSIGAGIAAFNVITLEHAEGILTGAERAGGPVILQVSENTVNFHGRPRPAIGRCIRPRWRPRRLSRQACTSTTSRRPTCGTQATAAGYSSVMVDAGVAPLRAERRHHRRGQPDSCTEQGLAVEAELGYVGGKDTQAGSAHAPGVRTDPRQGAEFVAATGVDALAVAVGSSHAMTTQSAELDFELIAALRDAVPVPLVLARLLGRPRRHAASRRGRRHRQGQYRYRAQCRPTPAR